MPVVCAVMVPHPPIIIPEIGRGEERKISATTAAYNAAAKFIRGAQPETLIITTPHSTFYTDRFHISSGESARGSFAAFRAPGIKLTVDYDTEFISELCEAARGSELPVSGSDDDATLDHGSMVPLWFISKAFWPGKLPQIVRIGLSGRPLADHYRLGMLIRLYNKCWGKSR